MATMRSHTASTLILLLLFIHSSRTTDKKRDFHGYCSICHDHTLCSFQGRSPQCPSLVPRPLGAQERQEVVAAHNYLRWLLAVGGEQRGSPGPQRAAANMRYMWYDDELADIAQRWADQCQFKHDSCRDVDRFSVGQNIYLEKSSGALPRANWNVVAGSWYDEVTLYSGNKTSRPFSFSANTGHFTQLSWADTFLIGCGVSEYKDDRWNVRLYVCNYGPAGNVIGDSLYFVGTPCSKCLDPAYCHYGLCV